MTVQLSSKTLAAPVLVAMTTLLGSTVAATAAGKNILWVQPMRDHPVHRLMQAGFLAKCKELGDTCEVVGNPSATSYDVSASIPLAEAAMARTKFDAIAVYGGILKDLDPEHEPMNRNHVSHMPQVVIDAFKAEGAFWGGDFHARQDPMHFQFATE